MLPLKIETAVDGVVDNVAFWCAEGKFGNANFRKDIYMADVIQALRRLSGFGVGLSHLDASAVDSDSDGESID
jgi:hypothetical protein